MTSHLLNHKNHKNYSITNQKKIIGKILPKSEIKISNLKYEVISDGFNCQK
jgi:hypothetical protein